MDGVAFTIFGLEIRWYAIMIVTGMLLGMGIAAILFKRKKIENLQADTVVDFAIVVLPLAIIGARLYYMVFSPQAYTFWALFNIPEGVSWWGLIIGLVLSAAVGLLAIKINPLKLLRAVPAEEGDKLRPSGARDIALFTLVTVALGLFVGRIVELLLYDSARRIYTLFNIRGGGMAIYGGVIFGALGMLIVCRWKKYKFRDVLSILDCAAPALLIGQAIGRWGNFFNQEAYGARVTDTAWQFFPYAVFADGAYRQATFFYEFAANLLGCALLFVLIYRGKYKFGGLATALYFVWYGFWRAIIEGMRTDSLWVSQAEGVRVSQLLSVILVFGGAIAIAALYWKELPKAVQSIFVGALSVMFLSSLLWVISEMVRINTVSPVPAFEYPIMLYSAVMLAGVGLAGLASFIFQPKKAYAITGAVAVAGSAICFIGVGLVWWAALIIAAVGAAACAALLVMDCRQNSARA